MAQRPPQGGWARGTRPTRSPSRSRTTSPRRWGWRSSTSRTRSGRTRRSWRSCSASTDDGFLDELAGLTGGREAHDAIRAYLDEYGMRCVGEIDITRPRWSEHPPRSCPRSSATSGTSSPAPASGASSRAGRRLGTKEQELLARLRALPDGERKADETKRMIDRVRTFIGYREYPSTAWSAATSSTSGPCCGRPSASSRAGVLRETGGHLLPPFEELHEVVRTRTRGRPSSSASAGRRSGRTRRSRRPGCSPPTARPSPARTGATTCRPARWSACPVSAGTVEGRARVVMDMAEADLEPGDILVTAFTDPSWTPAVRHRSPAW